MRVIQIAPTPFGSAGLFGGGERYPLELARALAPHIDTELVTFGQRAQLTREPSGLVRRALRAVAWQDGHPAHPLAPTLMGTLLKARADVVHTHHMRSLPSRLTAVIGTLNRTRLAVTDHGLQGSAWGGLLPRLFDLFLMVSRYSARELRAPAGRTRIIYGGADPLRYAPDQTQPRQGVLFVGRLTPHKGVDRLLRALPGGAFLRLVGSTGHDPRLPERDYPDLLRELAKDRDVEFTGPASDDDLPALYRSARVFVLPSVERTVYGRRINVSELLGLAMLEAMASGTPVIASRVGGVAEIVEDGCTGYLVSPGDERELHERLVELLGNPRLARQMGDNARALVVERFTWNHVAERCMTAYAELLQPDSSPTPRSTS